MTATLEPIPARPVVLHGVSWATYDRLVRELAEQHVFLTYDRGSLEIMSPTPYHERYKKLLARFIETLTLELNIPIVSGGSTTFRREDLERGLEPDECYYVQNESAVRETREVDLQRDPPPDLAIEMDYSQHKLDRPSIYAALGVPEVWRYDLRRLEVLLLQSDGTYRPSSQSAAFPFLSMTEVERFLHKRTTTDETSLVRQFRDWVHETLVEPNG